MLGHWWPSLPGGLSLLESSGSQAHRPTNDLRFRAAEAGAARRYPLVRGGSHAAACKVVPTSAGRGDGS